ncbi:MAG: hypothetical protein JOZ55_07710 [Alphaproteobacteria bacterium]|nr:hypothetical protein [Alphaproteobacteria bacterium]
MSLEDPGEYLNRLGASGESYFDVAHAALMLSALDHPAVPLARYLAHLEELGSVSGANQQRPATLKEALYGIGRLLTSQFGYDGDRLTYDDPCNADLMSVIDRRRGMPVALGILYLHASRASGCTAVGLNSPGHFLLRVGFEEEAALVDPFNGGVAIEQLAAISPPLPPRVDHPAESAVGEVSDIEVLLRLQNNLKLRALKAGQVTRAVEIASRMTVIAPRRPEVWFDLARLEESRDALGAARRAYESCLQSASIGEPLHTEATLALDGLRRRLN